MGINDHPPDKIKNLARQIYSWERGDHFPRDWADAYARAFGMKVRDLFPGLVEERNSASAGTVEAPPSNGPYPNNWDEDGEEMERRTLLQALVALGIPVAVGLEALQTIRSGVDRAVGRNEDGHLEEWEQTVADYGHTYRFAPPRQLMLDLAADLATVQLITSRSKKEKNPAYSSWCRVSAGLSLLMAKTLSNLDQPRLAREWWFTALGAAETSGDRDLQLWINSERLIHGLYEGRPTALLLREADKIIAESSETPCRGLLGVQATRAQLLSLDGADSQARAEIRVCTEMFEKLPPAVTTPDSPRSVIAGWPESRTRYTESWVYGHIGDSRKLDEAIGRLRDVHPLDSPRYKAQVELLEVIGHVRAGDVTEGVRRANEVYAGLPPQQPLHHGEWPGQAHPGGRARAAAGRHAGRRVPGPAARHHRPQGHHLTTGHRDQQVTPRTTREGAARPLHNCAANMRGMRLTLLGATGGTGRALLGQALEAGHEVTAVVRSPDGLPAAVRDRVTVVRAGLADHDALAAAVEGADAVMSALGSRAGRAPTTVCTDGARAIIRATGGKGRVLFVSASGLEADAGDGPAARYLVKPLIQRIFRAPYDDLREAERLLRTSTLDWTIVRPARLVDGPRSARPRTAVDRSVRGGTKTRRADLAACMLDLVDDETSIRHIVSVAS
ncbi:NAD(P)H-binding protein [Actinomadura sp. NBRC 104425]|uniref:NAD(P)-dependent oxidoreductase n=1 Tax=Actinomadura sp. NBRC 104425 TaxID=3032204 RepID=UPI002554BB6B|nr:NAD(P)H-binding protein [Actinomadura sp. NBRC 104425]